MLFTCKYCGRIHEKSFDCGKKPNYKKATYIDKFRWSSSWKKKAKEIKERDRYLCQACLHQLKGTISKYTSEALSVHHIVPINQDWDRRLDDDNLITLCSFHHEAAEKNEIERKKLKDLIAPSSGTLEEERIESDTFFV